MSAGGQRRGERLAGQVRREFPVTGARQQKSDNRSDVAAIEHTERLRSRRRALQKHYVGQMLEITHCQYYERRPDLVTPHRRHGSDAGRHDL